MQILISHNKRCPIPAYYYYYQGLLLKVKKEMCGDVIDQNMATVIFSRCPCPNMAIFSVMSLPHTFAGDSCTVNGAG